MSERYRSYQRPIVFVATVLAAAFIVTFPLYDHDLYWHLANGREMLARQRIINDEVFSFTKFGTEFSNHEWLSQLFLYELYQLADWNGLQLFKIGIAAAVAAIVWFTCRICGAGSLVSALLTVSAIVAGAYRYSVRPELFSLLLVAFVALVLHGYRRANFSARWLWTIPPIVVAWDWVHGALFGVVLIGLVATGENFKWWLHARQGTRRFGAAMSGPRLRTFNTWVGIAALCFVVNPYGLISYDIFIEFLRPNPQIAVIREFMPPSLSNYLAFWLLAVFAVVVHGLRRRWLDLSDVLVVAVFLVLSLRFSRVVAVFGILAAPALAALIARHGDKAAHPQAPAGLRAVLAGFAVLVAATTVHVKFYKPNDILNWGYGVLWDGFPVGATQLVRDTDLRGNMYNSGDFGGYLSFFLAPERRIFQYNHHLVFRDILYYVEHPQELDAWNINYAIVAHGRERRVLFPGDRWAEIYSEPAGVLVVRRRPENQRIIDNFEIRYFRPLRLGPAELEDLARQPAVFPRLAWEMAVYLSCRADAGIADEFVRLLRGYGQALPIGVEPQIVRLALRGNPGHAGLSSLARQPP
jgi:hypothetical protein